MARGKWIVRVAMAVALAWTAWGLAVMVTSGADVAVSLHPTGQTVQEVVRPPAGGSVVRIRLSSDRTIPVGSVVVADRQVTFGGRTTTTIQAGHTILSDAIRLSVGPQGHVAIVVYLPRSGDVEATLETAKD
ncbi:MAG TPA: hypothetical protein VHF06_04400 [Pseudonocardiaceae bacterium]|jgi:hypothetical protein|nr:hypothetical protein [Pseudonocardiaceae bacterium]